MVSSSEERDAGQSYPNCLAVHIVWPGVHKAILKAHWNKERKHQVAVSAKRSRKKQLQQLTQVPKKMSLA